MVILRGLRRGLRKGLRKGLRNDRSATSPVMGILLLVAITTLMAVAIAGFALVASVPAHTPQTIIVIDSATLYKSSSNATLQHIVLHHKGGDSFNVSDIRVTIAVNGDPLPNGLDKLPRTGGVTGFNGLGGVFHNWTGGAPLWDVGEKATINIATGDTGRRLSDGDTVTVIITYKPSKRIIARPSAIVQDLT